MINVVITGGCSGLGGAIVDFLCREEVVLTVIGRTEPRSLRASDHFVKLDLSRDISSWRYGSADCVSKLIFISNAGTIDPIGSTSEISISDLRINYNINCFSPFLIAAELSRESKRREIKLHIANISSGAANRALPRWAAYCSSKAATKMALDCLSSENDHVTVDHIDPGVLDTNIQRSIRSFEAQLAPKDRVFSNIKANGGLLQPKFSAEKIVRKLISD